MLTSDSSNSYDKGGEGDNCDSWGPTPVLDTNKLELTPSGPDNTDQDKDKSATSQQNDQEINTGDEKSSQFGVANEEQTGVSLVAYLTFFTYLVFIPIHIFL